MFKTDDLEKRGWVCEAATPALAKRRGKKVAVRPDWLPYRLEAMEMVLRLKFAPGSGLADKLLATGDTELVEWNTWNEVGLDVELRWLFWWRLGAQAGGGIGKVFPTFSGFGPQPWLPSGWVGLLYKVMADSDIRANLTAAVGNAGGALYFGIGQTF